MSQSLQSRQGHRAAPVERRLQSRSAHAPTLGDDGLDYDVAISYAREDVAWVRQLAAELESAGISVFFDLGRQHEMWGVDVGQRLTEVFASRSRLVVVVASKAWGTRRWTMHERNAVRHRLLSSPSSILPVTVGVKSIPGMSESIGHVDASIGIEAMVSMVGHRLTTIGSLGSRDSLPMNTSPRQEDWSMSHNSPQHQPMALPALSAQPSDHISTKGSGNRINSRQTVKHSQKHGVGAPGLIAILLVLLTAIGGLVWMFVDALKHAPRNDDGSIEFIGIPIPSFIAGDREPEAEDREPEGEDREPEAEDPEPRGDTLAVDDPTRSESGRDIGSKLAGIWQCPRTMLPDGFRTNDALFVFTETGRVTIRHSDPRSNTKPFAAPFSEWKDAPFTMASRRTIKVGDAEVFVDMSKDGDRLQLMGGPYTFRCTREAADEPLSDAQ